MGFEPYKPKRGGRGKGLAISFSPSGRIGFSRGLYDAHLSKANHVELFYDRARNKVGIKPVKRNSVSSIKLPAVGEKKPCAIMGKGFYKAFGLSFDKLKRVTPVFDEEKKMLIADLNS
ncbi:MAG: hypothetical protein K9N11_08665 [Lentisphaeria bacterium]|nr:hypothetical protein [Candidatus Neomarinimicrobiota bacterium]MCF7842908.1 hypothetical protein [Lentisphaeria bacterium]